MNDFVFVNIIIMHRTMLHIRFSNASPNVFSTGVWDAIVHRLCPSAKPMETEGGKKGRLVRDLRVATTFVQNWVTEFDFEYSFV